MSARVIPRVLVIGDVMNDIVARLEGPLVVGSDRRAKIVERPGGSAATQAVWLARSGVSVDFVGRTGIVDHDVQSEILRREGVKPHLAADPTRSTGRLIAIIDPSGERSFLTDRGANDGLTSIDIDDELIRRAHHICLSGYSFLAPSPREAVRDVIARAKDSPISVDPCSAEFLREIGAADFLAWTQGAAMLFPNADEAAALTGTEDANAQGEILRAFYPLVVIKRGRAGCDAWAGPQHWRLPAPAADVVDTTGAGDAFVAAFLAARLIGEGMEESLAAAAAAGSAATEFVGGRPVAIEEGGAG